MAEINDLAVTTAALGEVERRARGRLILVLLVITGVRLWMQSGMKLYVAASGADDLLYLRMAENIAKGKWLGLYDVERLTKAPGYPMWLALVSWMHVPVLLAEHLFCAGAYWVMVFAMRPVVRSTAVLAGMFAVMLFCPTGMGEGTWCLLRDAIYPEQCVLAASFLVGMGLRMERSRRVRCAWAAAAGGMLGWVAISREEGIWILPLGTVMVLWAMGRGWRLFRGKKSWRQGRWDWIGFGVIPVGVMLGIMLLVSVENYAKYRFFGVVEVKEKNFTAALQALQRVGAAEGEKFVPLVPVTESTMEKVYGASPAFAELRGQFDGALGDSWRKWSRDSVTVEGIGEREIMWGWWTWAFRNAAANEMYHTKATTASAFYGRVAREINDAIDSGRLAGGPKMWGPLAGGIGPRWRWEYVGMMEKRLGAGVGEVVRMADEVPRPERYVSRGDEAMRAEYAAFLHEQVIGGAAGFEAVWEQSAAYGWAMRLQQWYGVGGVVLAIFGAVGVVGILVVRRWRKEFGWAVVMWVALMAAAGARLLMLLYLDVASFPSLENPRYISPAQVFFLMGNVVVVGEIGRWVTGRRSR